MPTIEQNRAAWGRDYRWPSLGDEWSEVWGGVETHWHATLLPRIRKFIPARRIVEIAPGYGRWSGFLINNADDYVGIDLAEECVRSCRTRFNAAPHARFVQNDGQSFPSVADRSVDFVFSFDSLVHVEIETITAYLQEIGRTLTPEGVAFIHHSNLGDLGSLRLSSSRNLYRFSSRIPRLPGAFRRIGLTGFEHWRAPSVTASKVAEAARHSGLACIGQEIIDWGHLSRKMIDCLSVFALPGSAWSRPNVVVRNPNFMAEAFSANAISRVY